MSLIYASLNSIPSKDDQGGARRALRFLWTTPSCKHLTIAIVLLMMMGLGQAPWYAAFLIRSHNMTISELGLALGLIFGLGGTSGILLGSWVSARWLSRSDRSQMRMSSLSIAALMPSFALFLLIPEKQASLLALVPIAVGFSVFLGPSFALMQRLVPDEIRATTLAIVMLLANLIGMGIGPQIVGILSDLLARDFGQDALRYAMLVMSVVALWAAWHFWRAGEELGPTGTERAVVAV